VAINYFPTEEPDAKEVVALIKAEGRKAIALPRDPCAFFPWAAPTIRSPSARRVYFFCSIRSRALRAERQWGSQGRRKANSKEAKVMRIGESVVLVRRVDGVDEGTPGWVLSGSWFMVHGFS
jgi:hypothetical protein